MPTQTDEWVPVETPEWVPAVQESDWVPVSERGPLLNPTGPRSTTAAGPKVSLSGGAPGQAARDIMEAFGETITHPSPIPTPFEVKPQDSPFIAAGKEAVNLAVGIPQFFTSGPGIVAAAAGTVAPLVVGTAFTVDMLHNLGTTIRDTYKNWDTMTPGQKSAAIVNIGGTSLMTSAVGSHVSKGIEAKALELTPRGAGIAPSETTGQNLPSLTPLTDAALETTRKEPNAEQIVSTESLPVPALRESMGPRTSLRQSGEVAEALPQEPTPQTQPETPQEPIPLETAPEALPGSQTPLEPLSPVQEPSTPPEPSSGSPEAIPEDYGQRLAREAQEAARKSEEAFRRKQAGQAATPKESLPSLIQRVGRQKVEEMLGEYEQGAELSPDAKTITAFTDPRNQTGRTKIPTKDFMSWVAENENKAAPVTEPPPEQSLTPAGESKTVTPPASGESVTSTLPLTEKESSQPPPPADTPETGPGIIGMGGAVPSELPGAGDSSVTGLAERVRKEREASGHTEPTQSGVGIAPEASVQRGRQLLPTVDPEQIMADFEKTKRASSDDVAIVRAKAEELAKATNKAEETFGTDSQEFRDAFKTESDWAARTKAMQTEWAKSGHAQQGEVDIDTGTFSGLARAHKEITGKDFTPGQSETAKQTAKKVTKAAKATTDAAVELTDHVEKVQGISTAEKAAKAAADKTVREAAARAADAESKARVADSQAAQNLRDVQDEAARKSKAIADKTVTGASARAAKAETKERVRKAKEDAKLAKAQLKEVEKARAKADKAITDAAIKAAKTETEERILRADTPSYVWSKVKEYVDQGVTNFDDIRNKIAADLGMPVEKVTKAMAKDKRAKFLLDDLWKKQQAERLLKAQAKRWLTQINSPLYLRALQKIPRILFGIKVGFHGTVALGTHAPMVAFQPPFWKDYVINFGKMYRMVGTPTMGGQGSARAYYENQVQDLIRRPNYITARRAGLVNDPASFEDFNSPDTATYFGNLSGMGNRGYTILKILRQDMFDQHWNSLPRTAQLPEVAQAIADGVNHATGVVKGRAPTGSNLALFAPRLEASRAMWLLGDPVKAGMSVLNWKNATEGEKMFAIQQMKEKAWVMGTLGGLLALNQGFLSAVGSNQKVNVTDPMKSDFLKFKAAGMQFSYGNAMVSMARLPVRLYEIRSSDGGKLKNLVHPDESSYTVLGEYARSQLSPFASLASSLWFKSDWQNRPLPGSSRNVPKRLAMQGVKPYTWPEFWSEQVLPIPFEEAAREVWKNGFGMSPDQMAHYRKAMATIAVMAATGGRLVEDWTVPAEPPAPTTPVYQAVP